MTSPADPTGIAARRQELIASLAALRQRVSQACRAAGRHEDDVTVIAVTKTFPAQDVALLVAAGQVDFGESRDQEARAKVGAVSALAPGRLVRWHFVGQLQTNKARSVARYAHAVHSVDRPELVRALSDAAARAERSAPIEALVQVDLGPDLGRESTGRGGVALGEVVALADSVAAAPGLHLAGVMAVAPRGADPEAAFARLREISAAVMDVHPHAAAISAGMSHDLEAAIRHGATQVRVGSALLGRRPPQVH